MEKTTEEITPESDGVESFKDDAKHVSWDIYARKGQHTPKLKLKLKFDVFGHNSAISWRNCFFLGLLERGHQALLPCSTRPCFPAPRFRALRARVVRVTASPNHDKNAGANT
eukprot:sb/3477062/